MWNARLVRRAAHALLGIGLLNLAMQLEAQEATPSAPKALWQTRLQIQQTDFVECLSKDRILAGTIDIGGLGGKLKPYEIMLLNSANGEAIWTSPRSAFGYPQAVLATQPVILIEGSKQWAALNPDNGNLIWNRERAGEESLLLPRHDVMVVYAQKKTVVSISALNVKTGSQVWAASLDSYPEIKGVKPEAIRASETVLLTGPEVAAFSAADGKQLWRMAFPGTFGHRSAAIPLGDELYFTVGSAVTKRDPVSGRELWKETLHGGSVRNLTGSEQSLFVLLRSEDNQSEAIEAIDRNTGKPLWKSDLLELTASPMTIEPDQLYVTTPDNLVAMNTFDGRQVFKTEIPTGLQARRQLPDNLRVTSNKVIVARETGVMAVQKNDGKLFFAEPVLGAQNSTYDYSTNRMMHAIMSQTPVKQKQAVQSKFDSVSVDNDFRAALATQAVVYNALAAKNQYNMTYLANQVHDATRPQPGQTWTYHQERVAANWDMAGTAAVAGIGVAAAIITNMVVERTMERYQQHVHDAYRAHASSLQDQFYIRLPLVVNLDTGERINLFGPYGAFSTYGDRLVATGEGENPERVEKYSRLMRTHQVITYPSILAYDLTSLQFDAAPPIETAAAKPVDAEKKKLDDQLLSAAFRNDLATVKSTLDSGANVNAVDSYGQTPLMLAAECAGMSAKSAVVKLLLARGADPNIKDLDGLTALEHASLVLLPSTKGGIDSRKAIQKAQTGK